MTKTSFDILVIGAGASGFMAAITAKEENPSLRVAILEAENAPLKKLAATGNGRCNFTHENITAADYYSDDVTLLRKMTEGYDTEYILRRFRDMGMESINRGGYYYPFSCMASTVCNVLLCRAQELGIGLVVEADNLRLSKEDVYKASFTINGERLFLTAYTIILATGSRAGGFSKADSTSPAWDLGIYAVRFKPALAKILCKNRACETLAGVRVFGRVSLVEKEQILQQETGEIQFTKEGLSGISVFQLSGLCGDRLALVNDVNLSVDFLNGADVKETISYLKELRKRFPNREAAALAGSLFQNKVVQALLERLQYGEDSLLSDTQIENLVRLASDFSFTVTGIDSIKNAQVCRGGLMLSEFDENLQHTDRPGFFACGEVLNVDGPCGGYNLHFAWSSGMIAGKGAASYVKGCSDSL